MDSGGKKYYQRCVCKDAAAMAGGPPGGLPRARLQHHRPAAPPPPCSTAPPACGARMRRLHPARQGHGRPQELCWKLEARLIPLACGIQAAPHNTPSWPPPAPCSYRICPGHCTAKQLNVFGKMQRFCQQVKGDPGCCRFPPMHHPPTCVQMRGLAAVLGQPRPLFSGKKAPQGPRGQSQAAAHTGRRPGRLPALCPPLAHCPPPPHPHHLPCPVLPLQCAQFHPLDRFIDERRSCEAALEKHRVSRRERDREAAAQRRVKQKLSEAASVPWHPQPAPDTPSLAAQAATPPVLERQAQAQMVPGSPRAATPPADPGLPVQPVRTGEQGSCGSSSGAAAVQQEAAVAVQQEAQPMAGVEEQPVERPRRSKAQVAAAVRAELEAAEAEVREAEAAEREAEEWRMLQAQRARDAAARAAREEAERAAAIAALAAAGDQGLLTELSGSLSGFDSAVATPAAAPSRTRKQPFGKGGKPRQRRKRAAEEQQQQQEIVVEELHGSSPWLAASGACLPIVIDDFLPLDWPPVAAPVPATSSSPAPQRHTPPLPGPLLPQRSFPTLGGPLSQRPSGPTLSGPMLRHYTPPLSKPMPQHSSPALGPLPAPFIPRSASISQLPRVPSQAQLAPGPRPLSRLATAPAASAAWSSGGASMPACSTPGFSSAHGGGQDSFAQLAGPAAAPPAPPAVPDDWPLDDLLGDDELNDALGDGVSESRACPAWSTPAPACMPTVPAHRLHTSSAPQPCPAAPPVRTLLVAHPLSSPPARSPASRHCCRAGSTTCWRP